MAEEEEEYLRHCDYTSGVGCMIYKNEWGSVCSFSLKMREEDLYPKGNS